MKDNSVLYFLIFLFAWFSCSKMDSNYKDYQVPNGITYAQKPENVVVYSGYKRAQLVWPMPSDPNVKKIVIYYNNGADSSVFQTSQFTDSVRVLIPALPEGAQTFVIKTYDNAGHTSVPVEVTARIFGDKILADLNNRLLTFAIFNDGQLKLDWAAANTANGAVATKVTYTTASGSTNTYYVKPGESSTTINDYMGGSAITYVTSYAPSQYMYDTLYSGTTTTNQIFRRLDQKKWVNVWAKNSAYPGQQNGGQAIHAADGNYDTFWHSEYTDCWGGCAYEQFPHWIKVDITGNNSEQVTVAGVIINLRRGAAEHGFKDFTVMGNTGTGWFDMGTFTAAQTSNDQVFLLPAPRQVRYVQIYMLNSQINQFYSNLAELNILGY